MFDLSLLATTWKGLVAAQLPCAEEEIFKAKLSRLGVKALYGTPAAKTQLAKAIAKSYTTTGGSGNFMGHELNDKGLNQDVIRAELVVGQNVPYSSADKVADKFII